MDVRFAAVRSLSLTIKFNSVQWLLVCKLHLSFPIIFFFVHKLGFKPKSTIGKDKSVDVALQLSNPKDGNV
jgi:hypothetical protein